MSQTAAYFMTRGFEQRADAEAAAREFVEFCRGRLWVFTEAGTTARGEALYTFTHRTFLEYFTAAYLASIHDSPEQLARKLASRLAKSEWDTVGQLAVQIKDHTSERGADRMLQALLADRRHRSASSVGNILGFLGRCTAFVEPTPATVQELAARAFSHALTDISKEEFVAPLAWLMVSVHGDLKDIVAAELEARVRALVESSDGEEHLMGLRLALQLCNAPFVLQRGDEAWRDWRISSHYEQQLMQAQESARDIAAFLCFDPEKAAVILAHRGDLPRFLFEMTDTGFAKISWAAPVRVALSSISDQESRNHAVFGYFNELLSRSSLPAPTPAENVDRFFFGKDDDGSSWIKIGDSQIAPDIYLPAAYMICVLAEVTEAEPQLAAGYLGSLSQLHAYIMKRWRLSDGILPPLPLDERWQGIFTRWARREIDFTTRQGNGLA